MFFKRSVRLSSLISWCRSLQIQLQAGILPVKIFAQQAKRGPSELRDCAERIRQRLQKGEALSLALRKEQRFPPLFLSLVEVGEESGNLGEMFASLEDYYTLQQQLRRKFFGKITAPVLQFFLAVFVVAFTIYILGILGGGHEIKLTVFGLAGASGALTFLGLVFGVLAGLVVLYQTLPRLLKNKASVDAFVLRIPGIGGCLMALILSRFTLALHMTYAAGMPIRQALRLCLTATGNYLFQIQSDKVDAALEAGERLTKTLRQTRVFPEEFLDILSVAERGGQITEVMQRRSLYYHEEAGRRLTMLTRILAGAVWLIYAVFVIIMIIQLASIYFSLLQI